MKRAHNTPEIIDGTDYSAAEYIEWLQQLKLVNRLTQGYFLSVKSLEKLLQNIALEREITVLDLGCGAGDTLFEIIKWNQNKKYRLRMIGIDHNASVLEIAKKKFQQENLAVELILGDGVEYIKNHLVDIVMNSLFMHHLNDAQILTLLTTMSQYAKLGFIINDLHRHWLAYFTMWTATRIMTKNRLLKYDGPLSIQRSFKRKEWLNYCTQAGLQLEKISLNWHWSFRYALIYIAKAI